jgi:hypothetical protein
MAGPVTAVLVGAELVISLFLLVPVTAPGGGWSAFVVLTGLSGVVAVNLGRGRRPSCHCFGRFSTGAIGWHAVGRNLLLAAGGVAVGPAGQDTQILAEALAATVGLTVHVLATDINPAWLNQDGTTRYAEIGPAQRRADRLLGAFRELMTRRGADLRYGRTLPRTLREAGLADVAAAGSFPVGGAVIDRLEIASMRQVRAELVTAGLADDAEIDAHIASVGELDLALAPLISAWGRRPD